MTRMCPSSHEILSPSVALRRRDLLRLAGTAGVAGSVLVSAGSALRPAASMAAEVAAPDAWAVNPFALADVELRESVFTRKRDLMLGYARGYDVNRLLSVFRANAGLSTAAAVAPGGWEGLDGEANGNLRGHYGGHFLSMLAQAYASGGEPAFDAKLTEMVSGLYDCREALRHDDPWVLSIAGRFGQAVENVRGSYQYVNLPASVISGLTDFTLSVWVRPTRAQNWARIFEAGNSTSRYMFLTQRQNSGVPRFCATVSGGAGEQGVNGNAPLPLNEWSHLAVTMSGTTATLYVNGVAVGTNTAMALNPSALGPLTDHWLGRSHYSADPLYAGGLDELNVYGRALTAAEVAALQIGPAATSPVGRGDRVSYDFDDANTATIADASGSGRHATMKRTWGKPSHPGFLAAYPETQFITLESMTAGNYTVVWAPYYTAHKILKGLVDAQVNSDDPDTQDKALDLASGLCDWMYSRLSVLSDAVRQRMWGIFSSGEYGGIAEAIVDTWTITQKPEHLELAGYFDHRRLLDNCVADVDILDGLHANQHIPIFNGFVRMHDATGDEHYLAAARNFWPMVAEHRAYAIGGTSLGEFWKPRDAIASTLGDTNAETCCAHNMLKLSRLLFFHEQDPRYMDYYERTLFNQVLGSKQDAENAEYPLATYFIGLAPGSVRDFTPKAGTTCCEGTGMESATKYQDSIYFKVADDSALYVNLFIASSLDWTSKGVTVSQTTAFPTEQGTTITVTGSGEFSLRVRRPAWARTGYVVRVNGTPVDTADVQPGTYVSIDRAWSDGDQVTIDMPFTLRMESAQDDKALRAVFYGPIHLVARKATTSKLTFSLDTTTHLSGDLGETFKPVAGKPLHFMHADTEFAPFLEGTSDPFHSYVGNATQRVILGGVDSGVANVRGEDGVTILDDIWAAAPLADKGEFVDRVRTVASRRRAAGEINSADLQRLLLTAGKARVQA